MRNLLNKPWFVAVMAVLAVALVAHTVFSHGDKLGLPGFTPSDVPAGADGLAGVSTNQNAWAAVEHIALPAITRDPFALPAKAAATSEEMAALPDLIDTVHLSAIWTQGGRTLAVINDRICQGGDAIGRLKIESASPDGVWLSHWRGRDFISVGGDFTLNTPADRFRRAAGSL